LGAATKNGALLIFAGSGSLINSSVDGCIKMKSYLKGNPELKLVMNDDIILYY
jgi:AP-4 complex subunit mu-1